MKKHTRSGPARIRQIAVLAAFVLLAGCSKIDPYEREGVWRPSGANAANLAVMVANPADLAVGRGDPNPGIRTATTPVERMWRGPTTRENAGPAAPGGGAGAGGGSQAPGGGTR